jgi:hypothetical protein|tara:strand:- start:7436 stop:7858 length:423 start_codon:yes stop_codon:yes gene_type:complete
MNEKILVFIGGFIFAVVTASKAYAPNRDEKLGSTPPPPPPPPTSNSTVFGDLNDPEFKDLLDNLASVCPEGMERKPVFRTRYGMKPPEEKLERDRIAFEEAKRNAPCISSKEAAEIRIKRENAPIPPSARPRGTMLGFTG